MLNQVIGREETRGGKGLKMKTIEKRGSICPKRISAGPKGIVAIRASIGAIRKNAFAVREAKLHNIFISEVRGGNGRRLPFKPKTC